MVAKIPSSIKSKVSLSGSRETTRIKRTRNNDIGVGTVTDIYQQARSKDIPDIDLVRKLALTLKKENL